jgi:hypothetical protein
LEEIMPKTDFGKVEIWSYLVKGNSGATLRWARSEDDIEGRFSEFEESRRGPHEILRRDRKTLLEAIRTYAGRRTLGRTVEDPRGLFPEYWRFDDITKQFIPVGEEE